MCHLARNWLASLALLVVTLMASNAALTRPLLWQARDGDSIVYLFGTMHALKPDIDWKSRQVADALSRSDSLWVEAEAETEGSGDLIHKHGMNVDRPLSSALAPEQVVAVADLSRRLGVDFAQLDRMRPWMAAVTLTAAAMGQSGFTRAGADVSLAREASFRAIAVAGLDPGERPIEIFADLPPAVEKAMLISVAVDLASARPSYLPLFEAWLAGDENGLVQHGIEPLLASDPLLYDRVIAGRNRAWIAKLEGLFLGSGVHFVAVGSLHLVGPDSLRVLLAKKGYQVEPVRSF